MKKILLVPIMIIVLAITVFILASTQFFLNFIKGKIEMSVHDNLGVPLRIGSLRGNLFYVLEFEDVEASDFIKVDQLKISYNAIKLLLKEIDVNSISIDGLYIDLNRFETLKDNLPQKHPTEEKTETAFVVRIRKFSVVHSNLLSVLNNQEIKFAVETKGKITPDLLIADFFEMKTANSIIAAQGQIPINEYSHFDLKYNFDIIVDDFGLQGLNGKVRGDGKVHGNAQVPRISVNSEINLSYQEKELLGTIEGNWQIPTLDSLNFKAEIQAQTKREEKWDFKINAKVNNFCCSILSSYGSIECPGNFSGSITNPKFDAVLRGKFKYHSLNAVLRGKLNYEEHMLSITNLKIQGDKISAKLDALINTETAQIVKSDVSISCEDIELINNLMVSPIPIKGKLIISSKIEGKFDNPKIGGMVEIEDANFYGEEINYVYLLAKMKDHMIDLDSAAINSPRGIVYIKGSYDLENNAFATHLYCEDLAFKSPKIINIATIPISSNLSFDIKLAGPTRNPVGDGKLVLRNVICDTLLFNDYQLLLHLEDQKIDLSLFNDKKSVNLKGRVNLFKSKDFAAELVLNHFDLTDYLIADEGYITGQASIQGNLSELDKIRGDIEIDSVFLAVQKKYVQNLDTIIVDVGDGTIKVHSCAFAVQNQRLELQGSIPLDFTRGDLDLSIRSEKISVSDIAAMLPGAPKINGIFDIDVAIKGKPNQPEIDGSIRLEDIEYLMPNLVFDSVYCLVVFENRTISVDYLHGKINQGTFNIKGFASISDGTLDTMSAELSVNDVDFKHKAFGSAVFIGTIHASAKNDVYFIDGEIGIDHGVYDVPFDLQTMVRLLTTANRPPPQQDKILKQIYCNVGISAPGGIKIANNLANAEVDLDLQLKGYLSKLNVSGTIATSEKGTIQYLGKRFEITKAVMQFDNPYKIDPVLDLEASYFVSSSDDEYEIIMHLSGTIENWRLELTSNPPIPEYDIVSLLLVGERRPSTQILSNLAGVDIENTAKDYALSLMRGTIERKAEQTLGLEKVTITGDLLDPRQLDIGIEKRIARRFTLVYGTGIESWEMRRIGLNYDVTDNFSVYTLHDQENMNSSIDLDFHFKLK